MNGCIRSTAAQAIVISYFFSLTGLFVRAETQEMIGKVIEVKGNAWVTQQGTSAKNPVQAKTVLRNGDVIRTGSKSDLVIVVGVPNSPTRDAAMLIKENSEMKLTLTGGTAWLMDLKQGMIASKVRSQPKRPSYFRVKAGAAVMGVRGTGFFVKNIPGKELFVCPCVGTLAIESEKQEVLFNSKHHDYPSFISEPKEGSPLSKRVSPAPMGSDHTDADGLKLSELLEKG